MKIQIRRYKNKKLFEPTRQKFLTLAEVRHLLVVGNEILVRDTQTNDDVTALVLAQVAANNPPGDNKDVQQKLIELIRKGHQTDRVFMGKMQDMIRAREKALNEIIRAMYPKKLLSEGRKNASRKFSLS